jgi:hypothetical protein
MSKTDKQQAEPKESSSEDEEHHEHDGNCNHEKDGKKGNKG